MEVTIAGKSSADTIRGLMLQARTGEKWDKIVGLFTVSPNDPLARLLKCSANGVSKRPQYFNKKAEKQVDIPTNIL